MDNERLKRQLMAKYEALIDEIIAERKSDEEISFEEIEAFGLKASQAVGEDVIEGLSAVGDWEQPQCPECGKPMHNKGQRQKKVVTVSGEATITSSYYYCATCRVGFSPSVPTLGIDE